MRLDAVPPDVEEELSAVRKAVEALRRGAANHTPPQVLEPSHPVVAAAAKAHDDGMKDLVALGFRSLGDAGERRKDGSIAPSRWFADSDGTISGWLGLIRTKTGPRLLVFFVSEAQGPAYCTTLRGGSGLSLARPPFVSHADLETNVSLADLLRSHRARAASLTPEGAPLTRVATIDDALALMERLHRARMDWRASIDEYELLRADFRSVLANSYRDMEPGDFWFIYSRAAEWLGFDPERA